MTNSKYNVGALVRITHPATYRIGGTGYRIEKEDLAVGTLHTISCGPDADGDYELDRNHRVNPDTFEPYLDIFAGLDTEAQREVRDFADSLRKQAPPTEDDLYIWIMPKNGEEYFGMRGSSEFSDKVVYRSISDNAMPFTTAVSMIEQWSPATIS